MSIGVKAYSCFSIVVPYLSMMDEDLRCCKIAGLESLVQGCGVLVLELVENNLNSQNVKISAVNLT